jgi:ubiquinone/menaquinone biosynthesis C-methylase UbiE
MNIKVNSHFVNLEKQRHEYAVTNNFTKLVKSYLKKVNPEDLNTNKFWNNKLINSYEQIKTSPIYKDKIRIIRNFLINKSGNILDVGLGYGDIEIELNISKKLKWYGIDISDISIANISKKISGNFKIGNIFKIPFKNNLFQYVLCLDILEHLAADKVDKAYKEIDRVLNQNGLLIFSIPINENLDEILKTGGNPNGHMRIYTPELIKSELFINKFKIIKSYELYAFKRFYIIKNMLIKIIPFVWNKKPNLFIGVAKKQ